LAANADFIEGAINFSGDFAPTGGTGLGDATGIDFLGDDFDIDGVTGDFAAAEIAPGDIGFIQDFQFDPLPAAVDPLWAISGFSFTLNSVDVIWQSGLFLMLNGSGYLSGAGFDDTPGTWSLTGNAAGDELFNFSAGSAAIAVPEPGTLALFGLGLVGIGLARRRRTA
jgi:hypothetical protein